MVAGCPSQTSVTQSIQLHLLATKRDLIQWSLVSQIVIELQLLKGIIFNPSDPLFSLIIFLYVSVIFLYMFFAFCWYDGMPIATFSSYPERGGRSRRKRTYTRFVYPYPEDLQSTRNKQESLKDKNLAIGEEEVGLYFKFINISYTRSAIVFGHVNHSY